MAQPLDDAALDTIFRAARTYNGYTDAPVTQADIRDIYDLLKMGPTSANNQAARFVWLTTPEAKESSRCSRAAPMPTRSARRRPP